MYIYIFIYTMYIFMYDVKQVLFECVILFAGLSTPHQKAKSGTVGTKIQLLPLPPQHSVFIQNMSK